MANTNTYISAAIRKWGYDSDLVIETNETDVDHSPTDGAWVKAFLWVSNDELDPEPGPTYYVWISEYVGGLTGWSDWGLDQTFTCDDDPDGKQAKRNAHEYARNLRRTYHAAFVAVRQASKGRPPRRPVDVSPDPPFSDFSSSMLGL